LSKRTDAQVRRRRTAGKLLLAIGIPNGLAGLVAFIASSGGAVVLFVVLVGILTGDGSSNPVGDICLIVIAILLVAVLFLALIAMLVSGAFSIGLMGLSIAGYHAIKGTRYRRTLALTVIGIVASVAIASLLLLGSILMFTKGEPIFAVLGLLLSAFELLCSGLAVWAATTIVSARSTFKEPPSRRKVRPS